MARDGSYLLLRQPRLLQGAEDGEFRRGTHAGAEVPGVVGVRAVEQMLQPHLVGDAPQLAE